MIGCLAGWTTSLGIATVIAEQWASAWLPLAELLSVCGIGTALLRRPVKSQVLLSVVAVTSIALAGCIFAGWCGYDLPRLFAGVAAPGRMRMAATEGNPLFVASLLCSAMWSISTCQWLPAVGRYAMQVLVLLALITTGERTALVGVFAGAFVWLLASRSTMRRLALKSGLLVLAMPLAYVILSMLNPRGLGSAIAGRIFIWQTSLHHWTWFGSGAGSFYGRYTTNLVDLAPAMPPSQFHYVAYENQAHNLVVQQIVEAGPIGALCLAAFFAAWLCFVWRGRKRIGVRAALAGIAALLAASIFDNPLSRPEGLLMFAIWLVTPFLSRADGIAVQESSRQRLQMQRFSRALWSPGLTTLCSVVLMAAATAVAISSYATYAGEQAEQRAQWQAAEASLRRAIAFDPAAQDAHFDLVRVLAESGQFDAAWAESGPALRSANEAEMHLLRIRVLDALGRDAAARQELAVSQRQFPWSLDLRLEQVITIPTVSPTRQWVEQ